ncbi:AAA family ATPase [Oscillospiraceae bacterium LCP21S3_A1]
MKKLITLRGNSGSGKTTIARALQEKFGKNTMLLSQDVIRRDILKTNDGAGTRTNDVLIMLLEYGHAHNELVILEGILNSRWYTPAFRCRKSALRRKHLRVLF